VTAKKKKKKKKTKNTKEKNIVPRMRLCVLLVEQYPQLSGIERLNSIYNSEDYFQWLPQVIIAVKFNFLILFIYFIKFQITLHCTRQPISRGKRK